MIVQGRVIPKVDYAMKEEWKLRLKSSLRRGAEPRFEAGAREAAFADRAFPPLGSPDEIPRIGQFPIEQGRMSLNSAHNQSTCRMGLSRDNSVVDRELRLHTGDNIYVKDGSVTPTSASTHTMIPKMVAADYAVHRMLES
jgi:choline dehydrogenase-like flavoprotein